MTNYEIYVFILCLIVFIILAVLSLICVTLITGLMKRLIECGGDDERILRESEKSGQDKPKKFNIASYIICLILCLIFVAAMIFAVYINVQEESVSDTLPTFRVVQSDSMSEKYEGNTYLSENDLNDQFQMYDLILTYKMPDEYDLELYDIVVYERDGSLIIHRIVAIEEPNENHPDCRYFVMQGDANVYRDNQAVLYSQMLGIYRGEHIAFVGTFIMFLQSPAGWLCVLLLAGAIILMPVLESYIKKAEAKRLAALRKKGGNAKGVALPEGTVSAEKAQKIIAIPNDKYIIPAGWVFDEYGFYDLVCAHDKADQSFGKISDSKIYEEDDGLNDIAGYKTAPSESEEDNGLSDDYVKEEFDL